MTSLSLFDLGWSEHFARQLDPDLPATTVPARIAEIHRDRVAALSVGGPLSLRTPETTGSYAVGDWVLTDGEKLLRRLTPRSEILRKAAGDEARRQLIAANVDTLGIVTSCNADFNIARLERYIALASAGGCLPLVILTKADTCDAPQDYVRRAARLSPLVTAIALDARDPDDAARLTPWCGPAQTLALVGSSGVGKTTILNALTGRTDATQPIRAGDAHGRHTTTFRNLRRCRAGGWLIDTPGMRELQLTDAAEGIEAVFDDIERLAGQCRFRDCAHASEPGCAVRQAIEAGSLDPERLSRWAKLHREDRRNSETLVEARARGRSFSRMVRQVQSERDPKG